jgi:transaldolase
VKDPAYDDTRYVVELVAPGTVNTAPENTINAVADHGVIRGNTIEGSYQQSAEVFADLAAVGLDLDDVFDVLESEGVEKFEVAWTALLDSVAAELQHTRQPH